MFNIEYLSRVYEVKRLGNEDIDDILALCISNPVYYQHCPPQPNRVSIAEDLKILPPDTSENQKYFIGYYLDTKLIAILDLITNYPKDHIAYIGLIMLDASVQKRGIGSQIVAKLSEVLKRDGYKTLELAYVKGYSEAKFFWEQNAFTPIGESTWRKTNETVKMIRNL